MKLVIDIPKNSNVTIENGQVILDIECDDIIPRYKGIDLSLYYKGEKVDEKRLRVFAGKQVELSKKD